MSARTSFSKLFQLVSGIAAPFLPKTRAGIRKTAADEYTARKAKKEPAALEPQTPRDRFLAGLYKLTIGVDFQSSNPAKPAVYQVWYVPAAQEIHVTFFDHPKGGGYRVGPTYRYWTISPTEAATMYEASSKGVSVWDQMRVRGSKTLHKKSYARV